MITIAGLLVLVLAASLEVLGDVKVGQGLASRSIATLAVGWLLLIVYGVVVNGYNWVTKGMFTGSDVTFE